MKRILKNAFGIITVFGAVLLVASSTLLVYFRAAGESGPDGELISVEVNGTAYIHGTTPHIELVTDQIFPFKVEMKNTGTVTWGQGEEEVCATLMRYPDYDLSFGTSFILNGFSNDIAYNKTQPGESFLFDTHLRAPSEAGDYTMTWRLDGNAPKNFGVEHDFFEYTAYKANSRQFYGDEISVNVRVTAREKQAPIEKRVQGTIDQYDFEYIGSFKTPRVIDTDLGINNYTASPNGITLRTVAGEKRMMLTTRDRYVYEVAIPTPEIIENNNAANVLEAELRTVFAGDNVLTCAPAKPDFYDAYSPGTMWFDEDTDMLYWTNWQSYLNSASPGLMPPILYSSKLEGNVLTNQQQWSYPLDLEGPAKSYWGGVTRIPDGFADEYLDGRKLALGFGGVYSVVSTASYGPALGAISIDANGVIGDDFQSMMYYRGDNPCVRDGDYFTLTSDYPEVPWKGKWGSVGANNIRGVFIDLPDKKGYMAFAYQSTGRYNYDPGGPTKLGTHKNTWYFYDYETLGNAASSTQPSDRQGLAPSSYNDVDYPFDAAFVSKMTPGLWEGNVTAACFDAETRTLYVSVSASAQGYDYYPVAFIHAYHVKEGYEDIDYAPSFLKGQETMNLWADYDDTSTAGFVIIGRPEATVTKTSGNAKITWNDTTKRIDIAAGLPMGTYNVTLNASNKIEPDCELTFTLTVTELPPPPQPPPPPDKVPWKTIGIVSGFVGGTLLIVGLAGIFIRRRNNSS